MCINEMEEYLGILREKKAVIQLTLAAADDQIGVVGEALDSNGIPETSLSDDDDNNDDNNNDNTFDDIPPFSSDNSTQNTKMQGSSDTAESDLDSTIPHHPIHTGSFNTDPSPEHGTTTNFVKDWQGGIIHGGVSDGSV